MLTIDEADRLIRQLPDDEYDGLMRDFREMLKDHFTMHDPMGLMVRAYMTGLSVGEKTKSAKAKAYAVGPHGASIVAEYTFSCPRCQRRYASMRQPTIHTCHCGTRIRIESC
jgi:hypothetical protein